MNKATKSQIESATHIYNSLWPYLAGYRVDIFQSDDNVYLMQYVTLDKSEYYIIDNDQKLLFDDVEYDPYNTAAMAREFIDIADGLLTWCRYIRPRASRSFTVVEEINMAIKFTEKNQDWENETTEYWFDVDGVSYCLADNNGDLSLLDSGRHNVNNDSLLATLSDIYTREL